MIINTYYSWEVRRIAKENGFPLTDDEVYQCASMAQENADQYGEYRAFREAIETLTDYRLKTMEHLSVNRVVSESSMQLEGSDMFTRIETFPCKGMILTTRSGQRFSVQFTEVKEAPKLDKAAKQLMDAVKSYRRRAANVTANEPV